MPHIDYLAHRYGGHILFSRLNTIDRLIDKKVKTVLDIGCSDGSTMLFLNRRKRYYTTGVDISTKAIENASIRQTHDEYILGNALNLDLSKGSFDLVICLEMLEHLEKKDGVYLINKIEHFARRQVIISTPIGFHELLDHPVSAGADHLSGWTIDEFTSNGYTIRGNKLRIKKYFGRFVFKYLPKLYPVHSIFWLVLDTLLSPLPYFFPSNFAFDMICVKNSTEGIES